MVNDEIMDKGTRVLFENLGVPAKEQFISTILKEPLNYTEWSREYFTNYNPKEFLDEAIEYDKNHPVSIK